MKLSEIRPCDNCGGPITPHFYVVRMSIALFNPKATNQVLGMAQYFGGHLALAELFSPHEDVVTVAMDEKEHKVLQTELFLCQDCYLRPVNLAELAEKRGEQIEAAKDKTGAG